MNSPIPEGSLLPAFSSSGYIREEVLIYILNTLFNIVALIYTKIN